MRLFKESKSFFSEVYHNKGVIFELAKNDFKSRYAGSFFGAFWAFALPLVTILVFWFVFQVGFKSPPINDFPFILWFIPPYIIWNFFQESLVSATNTLFDYSYLVKKVKFPVSILPTVKIASNFFVHVFFIAFMFFMFLVYGKPISIYNLQIIYYFFCTVVFLTGLTWLVSALAAFFSDLKSIIMVITQIGFWSIPIFWTASQMSPETFKVLQANPMFYICVGYRDSFVDFVWFWEKPEYTVYFWIFTIILFFLGAFVFKKLKPHFADVL